MKNLETIFSEEFISALGWTLLHSLWQGALIALFLGIVLLFLQKKSSAFRYNLSAAALVLTLIAFMGTFVYLYQDALATSSTISDDAMVIVIQSTDYETIDNVSQNQGLFSVFVDYFNHHLPIIVVLWFLGVLVLLLRFLGGLAYLERLKYSNNRPINALWQEQLESIRQQVGVKKSIQLLESALVKVPMVVGYLKPIILLPIGTINALSQAEVEAILAHELAHIRRHDYIVNLIQSVIDVLFFYHPAIWWMSNAVRAERENCCDDLALRVTGNSLVIAKALANLEAFRIHTANLSLAFTGNKNQLLNRISRLLGQPMKKDNHFIEGIIAICIIIICLTTLNYNVNANSHTIADQFTLSDTTKPNKVIKVEATIKEEEGEILEEYIIIEEEIEEEENEFFFAPSNLNTPQLAYFESATPTNLDNSWFSESPTVAWSTASNLLKNPISLDEVELANVSNTFSRFEWVESNDKEFPQMRTYSFDMPENLVKLEVDAIDGITRWISEEDNALHFKKGTNLTIDLAAISSHTDTSILDKLDNADIIFIDGSKTIIIRKKGKSNEAERLVKIEARSAQRSAKLAKEQAKRELELAKIQVQREKEMTERVHELAKRHAELEQRLAKESEERGKEAAKREYEIAIKRYEIEAERSQKRLEMAEQRAKEHLIREEERLVRTQERLKEQELRIKAQQERLEKRREFEEEYMDELKEELIKDGIIKNNQDIKTLNINSENDKLTIRVNGKKIPKDKIKKYEKLLKKQEEKIKSKEGKVKQKIIIKQKDN